LELQIAQDRLVGIDGDDPRRRAGPPLLDDLLQAVTGGGKRRLGQRLELGGLHHPGEAAFRLECLVLGRTLLRGLKIRLGAEIGDAACKHQRERNRADHRDVFHCAFVPVPPQVAA
jgi:hypothetical protein